MNKILNVPENFVSETLEGILLASNQKLLSMDKDNRVIVSNYPCKPNKVGIVTAGGSGHLPTFLGYVGKGMLDGCTVGNVFASPSASKMADTIRACDKGSGVLCLYGNYGGDHMNFTMAREEVEFDGISSMPLFRRDLSKCPREFKSPFFIKKQPILTDGLLFGAREET